jgi:isoquinoline 1-oxidoreductase alpha subunit
MVIKKSIFMSNYTLNVNGEQVAVSADADTPLLWVLRDELDLVGTKFGCGIAQCGACTVHINGVAARSCQIQVAFLEDTKIVTIEGLSVDGKHPVQEAWKEIDVPQCGYCQTGQIMTATAFLVENKRPSDTEIRAAMQGNICRCASYNRIEKAVKVASEKIG